VIIDGKPLFACFRDRYYYGRTGKTYKDWFYGEEVDNERSDNKKWKLQKPLVCSDNALPAILWWYPRGMLQNVIEVVLDAFRFFRWGRVFVFQLVPLPIYFIFCNISHCLPFSLFGFSDLSLCHNCDSNTIRWYHDTCDYNGSDQNYDLRSIWLWCDYDTTMTKNWHVHFLLAWNHVEWKQERVIRRSCIVVVL